MVSGVQEENLRLQERALCLPRGRKRPPAQLLLKSYSMAINRFIRPGSHAFTVNRPKRVDDRNQSRKSGFTLVELLVVLIIMSILSAFAVPAYNRYVTRARQGQAQQALASLRQYEEMFRFQNGTYTNVMANLTALGYGSGTTLYAVAITAFTATTFTAAATGNIDGDATVDQWTINELGDLQNPVNDVTS
jgi:type IV pilus assembly protein PilE